MTPIVIESEIRSKLLTLPAVTALVGSGDAARIRAGELAQKDTLPAVTIELETELHDSEDLTGSGGLISAMLVVSSHAEKYSQARQLCQAIAYGGTDPSTGLSNWSTDDDSIQCLIESTARRLVALNDAADGRKNVFETRYRVTYREPG